jgi:hypothetical protein
MGALTVRPSTSLFTCIHCARLLYRRRAKVWLTVMQHCQIRLLFRRAFTMSFEECSESHFPLLPVQQLLHGYHTNNSNIPEQWDGCSTAEVCRDTAAQQKHHVLETPYSLSFISGNALEMNSFQQLVASVEHHDTGKFMKPSVESLLVSCPSRH